MEPTKEPKSESRRGLYIAIIIIILLVGGYLSRGPFLGMKGMMYGWNRGNVNIDRNYNGRTTYTTEQGKVTVGGGSMPADWPSDAPTYTNAKIENAITTSPESGTASSTVIFTTVDSLQAVIDFYKKELPAKGWTANFSLGTTMGNTTTFSAKKDNRFLNVSITNMGTSGLRVTETVAIIPEVKVGL